MTSDFLFQLFITVCGFLVLGYFLRKWISEIKNPRKEDQVISELLHSFDVRSHEQTKEIREQTKSLNTRLDNAARIIAQVQRNIGEFSEIGRSMKELEEFLKSPKLRGNIGEEVLSDLISQMFPKGNFYLQYSFKSGVRVDAAIKTDAGILPIDAKFPLENYQLMIKSDSSETKEKAKREFSRDIKKHIESIAQKYILPEEGTLDFAMMYIPSESVFYELIQFTEIMEFARRKRVYPVSPTTLYAHLQMILLSFAGKKLETKSREVFKLLRSMTLDYEKVASNLSVLNKHLTNAYNQANEVNRGFNLLGQKLSSTHSLEEKID